MSLIMAGIVMLYSAVHIEKNECKYTGARHYCQYFDEKIGAGVTLFYSFSDFYNNSV
jgi:hypothetical protein